MTGNCFGNIFKVSTFGESHGKAMGSLIDGCPAGIPFNEELLLKELKRRRPGLHGAKSGIVSSRNEDDIPEILSGVFDGKTLGTPIAIVVRNNDMRSSDYDKIKYTPRVGHADDVWKEKFGHVDHRGGGRSSGRETISRVIGGAVAQMVLKQVCPDLKVFSFARSIGMISLSQEEVNSISFSDKMSWLPIDTKRKEVEQLLLDAKKYGKSYGGLVEVRIKNTPKNLGQPVFNKLKADLAHAVTGIGAVVSFEFGDGAKVAELEGSEFHSRKGHAHYGGIRGGISTGEEIILRTTLKPTATVLHEAKNGRHDPCIIPRALSVIEAMIYMVLLDHYFMSCNDKITR